MYWWRPPAEQDQGAVAWEIKATVSFCNAISAVRRWLWTHWVVPRVGHADQEEKGLAWGSPHEQNNSTGSTN
jgi:hypothetical protein